MPAGSDFCCFACKSTGRPAGSAGHWREATAPPSHWNDPEWVCDHCAPLICAGHCIADEINAARVWVWRVAGLWYMRRSAVPPLAIGGWGQTQTWVDSVGTVRQWCACRRGWSAARIDRSAVGITTRLITSWVFTRSYGNWKSKCFCVTLQNIMRLQDFSLTPQSQCEYNMEY